MRRERRRRRRWPWPWLLALAGGAVLVVLAAYGGYRAGLAEGAATRARLLSERQRAEETVRILEEKLARTEARLDQLRLAYRELETAYRRKAIEGELEELLALVRRRLAEGVPLERLRFLIASAAPQERCDQELEAGRVYVRVPLARGVRFGLALADGRIALSVAGRPARDEEGRPEAWFDPAAPVAVEFVLLDGSRQRIEGTLPLVHRLVAGGDEYRIGLQPDSRRGWVRVAVQRCDYP